MTDLASKKAFVGESLRDSCAVLDLGCNAGEYSRLAFDLGKRVVAADGDHAVLSRLYSQIRGTSASIMPVFLNIGRPTPAVGWGNREVASFLDRAAGQFDCVLMLGLIHHLLVTERATLPMLLDLLDGFGARQAILEWVEPFDPKFEQLAGLNSALYRDMDAAWFESVVARRYRLVSKLRLPCGSRVLYLWSRLEISNVTERLPVTGMQSI